MKIRADQSAEHSVREKIQIVGGCDPIRVLQVIPGQPNAGSMIFVRRQVESLRKLGLEARVFYLGSRTSPVLIFQEWRRFRRELSAFRPHLIHSQFGTATSFFCAVGARVPLVITFRGSDLNPTPSMGAIRSCLGRFLSQLSALRASRIICVSRNLQKRLWWRQGIASVLPSGPDLDLFVPRSRDASRAKLGWPTGIPIVLFNAGKEPAVKRLDLAEAAFERARSVLPGLLLKVLRGETPPDAVPTMLNAADCLLFNSDWEGSPNIVKEAMACNLPVVSVPVGDVGERLQNVSPTRIVTRDPVNIAHGLVEIIRLHVRSNGREHIKDLSEAEIAIRLLEVYKLVGFRRTE